MVTDALDAGHIPQVVLYDPDALGKTERGRGLIQRLASLSRTGLGQAFEATPRALTAAGDTQHPQGVVAAFPIPNWPTPSPGDSPALAVICDDVQDPGNLGTILRTAEAAGVSAVWLTERCVDLYGPKVVRAGMGAHFRLPCFPEASWGDIEVGLGALNVERDSMYAADADAPFTYDQPDWSAPSALIVSNEAHGLSEEARLFASGGGGLISIPMLGGTESLNAAIATAVILFEAARQRRAARLR